MIYGNFHYRIVFEDVFRYYFFVTLLMLELFFTARFLVKYIAMDSLIWSKQAVALSLLLLLVHRLARGLTDGDRRRWVLFGEFHSTSQIPFTVESQISAIPVNPRLVPPPRKSQF